jgi:hypothetical protein
MLCLAIVRDFVLLIAYYYYYYYYYYYLMCLYVPRLTVGYLTNGRRILTKFNANLTSAFAKNVHFVALIEFLSLLMQ